MDQAPPHPECSRHLQPSLHRGWQHHQNGAILPHRFAMPLGQRTPAWTLLCGLRIYRGVYWIVDDGSYYLNYQNTSNGKLSKSSQHLLPANVLCEFASGKAPEQHPEPEAKRRSLRGVSFAFANVTLCGNGCSRDPGLLFLAETHLAQEDNLKAHQRFAARGFGVLRQPAAESAKGGTHGAFMLLYPSNKNIVDGCGWYATQWTFHNVDVIIAMAYFCTEEGIQGPTMPCSGQGSSPLSRAPSSSPQKSS